MEKNEKPGERKEKERVVVKARFQMVERSQTFLGVIVVLAVVLAGATGWFWWKGNRVVSENLKVTVNNEPAGLEENGAAQDQSGIRNNRGEFGSVEDWQIYTSQELGLIFKYPEGWQAAERDDIRGRILMVSNKEIDLTETENDPMVPVEMQVVEGETIDEMMIEAQQIYEGVTARLERLTGELGGAYLTGETDGAVVDGELVQVFIPWGDKLLQIVFVNKEDDEFSEELFRRMIKTIEQV